jgi:hypothetical protein
MTRRRPTAGREAKTAPRESKAQQDRRIALGQFVWTRRSAVLTAVGIVVAIAAIVVSIILTQQGSTSHSAGPSGVAVNVVPQDRIGGAAIFPVPGGQPSDYLGPGWSLYVDCLQQVRPHYMFARISDGPYKNHWIDVFDIKRPRGEDVRFLKPPLPQCGPPVNAPSTPTRSS